MTTPMPLDQYRPYDSVGNDRAQRAAGLASMIGAVLTDGVMPSPGTSFFVSAAGGWDVSVAVGKCVIAGGRLGQNDAAKVLTLDPSSGTMDRIDSILVRHDEQARQILLKIGKGTPSASPVPVALQRDADAWEMCLARIRVGKTATQITQGMIADTRQDATVCGIVNSLVQVDASSLFAQYNAAFSEYFAEQRIEVEDWKTEQEALFATWSTEQRDQQEEFQSAQEALFDTWFAALQTDLAGDVAASLAARIEDVALKSVQEVSRTNATILPGDWAEGDENWTCTLPNSDVLSSGRDVDVTLALDSVTAPVYGVGTPIDGGVILYAAYQPSETIHATVIVRKVGA